MTVFLPMIRKARADWQVWQLPLQARRVFTLASANGAYEQDCLNGRALAELLRAPAIRRDLLASFSGVVQVEGGVAKLLAEQAAALVPTGVMAEPNSLWLNGAPLPDMPALQGRLGYGIQFELQRLQARSPLSGVSCLVFPLCCRYPFLNPL